MDEDAIARAIQTAVSLGSLGDEGDRASPAHFAHTINVYLNSAFAVASQAAEAMAKNEPLASNQRGVIINTTSISGFEAHDRRAGPRAIRIGWAIRTSMRVSPPTSPKTTTSTARRSVWTAP